MSASSFAMSYYPAGTPKFEPMSPVFEDRTHPASLTPCGIHNPALLELIRTDVSREMVCKYSLLCLHRVSLTTRLPRRTNLVRYCMLDNHSRPSHPSCYPRQVDIPLVLAVTRSSLARDLYRRRMRTVECSSLYHPRYTRLPRTTTRPITQSRQGNALHSTSSLPRYPHCRCQVS